MAAKITFLFHGLPFSFSCRLAIAKRVFDQQEKERDHEKEEIAAIKKEKRRALVNEPAPGGAPEGRSSFFLSAHAANEGRNRKRKAALRVRRIARRRLFSFCSCLSFLAACGPLGARDEETVLDLFLVSSCPWPAPGGAQGPLSSYK